VKRVIAAVSLTIAGLAFLLGFKTRDTIPAIATDTTQPTSGAADTTTTSPAATATTGTATTGAPTEYATITETMSPVALQAVSGWIKERFAAGR